MKQSEFLRWLIANGVTTEEGTRHIKLYYRGKQSTLPRHPSKELKTGLVNGVKKQLGIK
ncbi:type II toxin-antitoxin system HicA family toxin [Haemophilus sputorum]|jgi:mRNA interferase HicA|uniref:type II toxin-antitoxin system HicA family toxin n=1 Tax=Haemophilus sputorum TaxID=1078480 RepID=UPI0034DA8ECA